jgi:hypothetical protein
MRANPYANEVGPVSSALLRLDAVGKVLPLEPWPPTPRAPSESSSSERPPSAKLDGVELPLRYLDIF